MSNALLQYIDLHKQDAVIYKTIALLKDTDKDMYKRSLAVDQLRDMLANVKDEILSEYYTKLVAGYAGVKAATLPKVIKEVKEKEKKDDEQYVEAGKQALPKWVDKTRLNNIGFDWRLDEQNPDNTGIYFPLGNNWMERRTNFTMKPIVHIMSQDTDGNRRITEMNNGYGSHVFELPSKAFLSTDIFESLLMDQGRYFLDGLGKGDLNKLKTYFLFQYPMGFELENLGWQDEGFFAFSNFIYRQDKGLIKFDEYGLAEIDDVKYLSMGSSNILKNLRKGTDRYKDDKYLRYDISPITFGEWARLLTQVYDEKAMMLIAWALLASNRDIVAERTDYCPIPYGYGAAQSGKSQFMASLSALYFKGRKPFNLNQGTEFAFWSYGGRFKNVPAIFNEFDENAIDPKRTKAFKSMADIEGRIKGTGKGNKTETQEPVSLPVILGQYLATMDDGSVLGRTIPEKFVENNNRSQEQIDAFNKLKNIEKQGISSLLCPILEGRKNVEENYLQAKDEATRALKAEFAKESLTPKNRVIENYTTVLALIKLYEDKLDLGFTYDEFYQYCKTKILTLNNLISESNSLGEFWKTIEQLADNGWIEAGWDFKVEAHTEVKSLIGDKNSKIVRSFEKPTRLLFIRLNNVYGVFAKEKRQVTGKSAIPYDTIKSYLQEQPYFIGTQSNGNFNSKKQGIKKGTSSMVINYDMLNANDINLERLDTQDEAREEVTLEGLVTGKDGELQSLFGVEKVVFTLYQDKSYINEQKLTVTNHVYTKCFLLETSAMWFLKIGAKISIDGMLSVTKKGERVFRNMEVTEIALIEPVPGSIPPAPATRFTPTPVQTELSYDDVSAPGDDVVKDEF
jgi:hypothetical protein